MTVGCVTEETKLFKTQKADGIMGLSTAGNLKSKPIYYHLHEAGLIEHLEFSLCLGHNGGKFIVGGYDEKLIVNTSEECQQESCLQWTKMRRDSQFKVNLEKIKVGNIIIPSKVKIGFIDSGTTYTYMTSAQKAQIDRAITSLCETGDYNCYGKKVGLGCYKFKETKSLSVKDFFLSYPILSFVTKEGGTIKWFPSEYFIKFKDKYCLAIDPYGGGAEIIMGGSSMRQTMFIFDKDNNRVGYARAKCSEDANMIMTDSEIFASNKAEKTKEE